jgi:threonine/homoserine/homoserine lactone efflux protein
MTSIPHALTAFLIASSLLTITPGLDTMLVLRVAAGGRARAAIAAGAGICLGLLTWGMCTSVGLGALLNASRLGYNTLRIAGSCYLILLGYRMFRRGASAPIDEAKLTAGLTGMLADANEPRRWFLRGLLTNLLNPKVGVFYVTFLPLFIPTGSKVIAFSMLLACIHVLEGIVWFGLLIAAVRPFSAWLAKPRVVRTLDYVTGTVFVGFGLGLLVADR